MYFILLYLIILNIIYNISGLLSVIEFFILTVNFLIATWLLMGNPENFLIRAIQLICLILTVYVLFINIQIIFFNI